MNKSQIFTQAHKLAKSVHVAGDCYRVTFGAALKIIIKMSKKHNVAVSTSKGSVAQIAKLFLEKSAAAVWDNEKFNRVYVCSEILFAIGFSGKAFFDLDINALVVEDINTNPVEFIKKIHNKYVK